MQKLSSSGSLEHSIPRLALKRIVIIGGGFAGLSLAKSIDQRRFQTVLLDRENFHQFQPLFYQVATSGLEPSSISFPIRKIFQKKKNFHFRLCDFKGVNPKKNEIETSIGNLNYDYLVFATGAVTNYFGNQEFLQHSFPMKSVSEALQLRNQILENYEKALTADTEEERETLMQIVIVGGGPTGVEVSGALAEMKKYVLPKDYPELNFSEMKIRLFEASPQLLNGMSNHASRKAKEYLEKLGVEVTLGAHVESYDGKTVKTSKGEKISSSTMIWAAGISSNGISGLDKAQYGKGNRVLVDKLNKIIPYDNVFAIGDFAMMVLPGFSNGHPQLAPVAIQQGKDLAGNLKRLDKNITPKGFTFTDKGTMATVGRNLAVVDLPFLSFSGFSAWLVWMAVHLMSILGVKNRLFVFLNWLWSYVTYDQSLRLIIRPKK